MLLRMIAFFAASSAMISSSVEAIQTKIKIASPKNKAEVAQQDVVSGFIGERGHPFILVRPKLKPKQNKKNPWWVQPNVQIDAEGRFIGQAHFGNKLSTDGTEFETVAILVKDLKSMEKLQKSYSIDQIPRTVVRSRTLIVKLNSKKKVSAPIGFVSYPQDGDLVGRKEILSGIIPKFGTPVVFVRAEKGDGIWWTQSIIAADPMGRFKSNLYFGNEDTPNKSRFQIAVVVLQEKDAAVLAKGKTFKSLPRDHLGLQTITVELQHEITRRNATQKKK